MICPWWQLHSYVLNRVKLRSTCLYFPNNMLLVGRRRACAHRYFWTAVTFSIGHEKQVMRSLYLRHWDCRRSVRQQICYRRLQVDSTLFVSQQARFRQSRCCWRSAYPTTRPFPHVSAHEARSNPTRIFPWRTMPSVWLAQHESRQQQSLTRTM